MRLLDDTTLRAWLETHYCAQLPGATHALTIGRRHPGLDSDLDHRPWHVMTPYNPRGRQLSDADNRRRLDAMKQRLERMNTTCYPVENHHPAGCWPLEAGLLAVGLDDRSAAGIARAFDQDGMIAGMPGARAELWLLQVDLPDPLPPHMRRVHG